MNSLANGQGAEDGTADMQGHHTAVRLGLLSCCALLTGCVASTNVPTANTHPTAGNTTVLGPFAGPRATLHPDNTSPRIAYSGADLGWSYEHQGKLKLLFGDTLAKVDSSTNTADPIDPEYGSDPHQFDDSFGEVDLSVYGDPGAFPTSGNRGFPLISLGQHSGQAHAKALNPGHWMDAFKTPFGGWSNGRNEYAVFFTFKPQGCRIDTDCDGQRGNLSCDTGLGYWGAAYGNEQGFTFPCADDTGDCVNDTMSDRSGQPVVGTGFCIDRSSNLYGDDALGRILGVGHQLRIGIRNTSDDRRYDDIVKWLTNKFKNITVAAVQDFQPAIGSGAGRQNYNVAGDFGDHRRVFLWGRPGFVGVRANDRNLGLYFAYVNMPTGGGFGWEVNYYTGTRGGLPQFSLDETDAVALDLDADTAGIQIEEEHDNVFLQSVVWAQHLKKWIMFYGGGITTTPVLNFRACGALELFVGSDECKDVDLSNSAIHMRTADDPWGPWSPPQDVFEPGSPTAGPPTGQYAANGILYHPDCKGDNCAPHFDHPASDANRFIGVLYAPIIHAPWIAQAGKDVDLIWSVSTANPYGVVLLRTRINAD